MLFAELLEILDPEPHSAPLNMAIDEALLRSVAMPTLRIYHWAQPAVSFGYFGKLEEAAAIAQGRALIRRWTGGGIVEHGADLTYTLVVPRDHLMMRMSALDSYRAIHEVVAALLSGEGLCAQISGVVTAAPVSSCFVQPVQYDVVAGSTKLAGAAQRRTRWGMLHQGSIHAPESRRALSEKLGDSLSGNLRRLPLPAEAAQEAARLVDEKYGRPEWLAKF